MRRRDFTAILCTVFSVGAVLAACDNAEPGKPTSVTGLPPVTTTTTASGPPTSSSATLPFAGAPKVDNPLDASKYVQSPCLSLTSQQTASLKVGAGKQSEENLGLACSWSNLDTGAYVNFQFLEKSTEGLSAVYRANDEGKYEVFEPIGTVEGFPAVIVAIKDASSTGLCIVDIGLSDELVTQLTVTESQAKVGSVEACDVTRAVAQQILQTMKAGA